MPLKRITRANRRELLSTREAAERLGVHERTLRRYIACGQIAYRRLPGGHYRITAEAIERFWKAQGTPVLRDADSSKARARRGPQVRRPRLADEQCPERDYDLSSAHLAELRERVAAVAEGGSR